MAGFRYDGGMDANSKRLLSDEAWKSLEAAIQEAKPKRGRPARCDRSFVDAVRWMLRTGAPWRDLPAYFGPWQTVYRRFSRWSKAGRWQALWRQLDGDVRGRADTRSVLCIDSTSIRVHAHGSPAKERSAQERVGTSRGGRTTKLHLACTSGDGHSWRCRRAMLSPGQMHDILAAVPLIDSLLSPAPAVAADKAYDAQWLREHVTQAGGQQVIPSRQERLRWHDSQARLYRQRNVVERAFGRLKQFRRAASRYDRLAAHFGSFVQFALGMSLVTFAALPR